MLRTIMPPSEVLKLPRKGLPLQVAAHGVLDLDDVGAPVREQPTGGGNEGELRHLEDPNSFHHVCHVFTPRCARRQSVQIQQDSVRYLRHDVEAAGEAPAAMLLYGSRPARQGASACDFIRPANSIITHSGTSTSRRARWLPQWVPKFVGSMPHA